jgi:hypothetical protein
MELVRTISDNLAMNKLEIVDKVELGGGVEGYYICKVLTGKDTGGWKDREIAVFDEHFYTNTEFLRPGFKVKGALKLLGGFTGERIGGKDREKRFERREKDRSWEGYVLRGPIVEEAYLGPVVDVGIPIHCQYMLSKNLPIVEKIRVEGLRPEPDMFDIPDKGEWITAIGGLYIYLLKELKLLCSGCGKRKTFLTTSLPTNDELTALLSVCRKCKHEQESNAFPDICDKCKKKMWQWKGKAVEFPLECECGNERYDFFYDHKPMFIE